MSEVAIREAIAELRRDGRPNEADALRLAENCARGRLSKFQKCLPPRLESAFLAEVLTDPAAARLAIAGTGPSSVECIATGTATSPRRSAGRA